MNLSRLPRRKISLLVCLIFICGHLYSEEKTEKEGFLSQKINERSYQNWINYYVPFFTPTEAQLKQKLQNDPEWKMYFEREPQGLNTDEIILRKAPERKPLQNNKEMKKDQKPEGALFAVAIPKRGEMPQAIVVPKSVMDIQSKDSLKEIQKTEPVKQTKDSLLGVWTGRYNKLIEYYDPQTKQWNESKSSLKEQNIKLEIQQDGQLSYVLPDREGSAVYNYNDQKLTIDCEDVRMRGEYDTNLNDGKIDLKTTRILIKDKMRTTIQMSLAKQSQK